MESHGHLVSCSIICRKKKWMERKVIESLDSSRGEITPYREITRYAANDGVLLCPFMSFYVLLCPFMDIADSDCVEG